MSIEEKLRTRIIELKQMREKATVQLNAISGAISEMENILKGEEEE